MVKTALARRSFTFCAAGLALGLTGCAGTADDTPPRPIQPGKGVLTPWLTLDGGWRTQPTLPLPMAPAAGPRLRFLQPVGVAAAGDLLLVADAGARTLWRLERGRDVMEAFAPFTGGSLEQGVSLQIGNDLGVWVALPAEHQVVQYDARGRVVRRFQDQNAAPRPVAVAVPDSRSEVLVADGAGAQVLAFDPLGRSVRLLTGGRSPVLQSIAAMVLGAGGLYVLDRLAQQVVVLGPAGEVREIIGEHHLVRPRALAVDRAGRVFVSDDADQSIKVFRGADLLASAGGAGAGSGRFGRIESLAADGNMLYVADSVNARVQVMLVAPPSMEGRGAGP